MQMNGTSLHGPARIPSRLAGRRVLVLGLGRSGVAAAELLNDEGVAVTVLDSAQGPAQQEAAERLARRGIDVRLGWPSEHPAPDEPWEFAVTVPGIPITSVWISELLRRGVRVVSELEYGWSRRGSVHVAAITGSNGKSTAVKLLAECIRAAGARSVPAGNYGVPVCEVVRTHGTLDWWVLEVSSFQLETCWEFRPDVGVVLNVQPNHLDRHGDMATYRALKMRLFVYQRPSDAAILPQDQLHELLSTSLVRGRRSTFGITPAADWWYSADRIVHRGTVRANIRGTWMGNEVLGPAAAAVAASLDAMGLPPEVLELTAHRFEPLPHRCSRIAELDGVLYINDSKSTTVAAIIAALRQVDRPVRLIAGGRSKERDFTAAIPWLAQQVRAVYLIGEAAAELASAWSSVVPCILCGTLSAAVERARREARTGEAVVLSPGCTSFDQFRDFEERGETFERLVREWV
jgi:UDP-N-acetylmuramoylalanine--D-glutamate ligase